VEVSLAFGQLLAHKRDVLPNNMIYVFMTAAVLFLDRYDRWILGPKPIAEPTSPPAWSSSGISVVAEIRTAANCS